MSWVVAFLYRNALLGVACIVVLWPFGVVAPYVVWIPVFAALLLIMAALLLWIVFEARSLWRQRRRVTAAMLASVLIVPYAALHLWIVEGLHQSRAPSQQSRARSQAILSFRDRIATDGKVTVSEVVSGWDTVCACTIDTDYPFTDCYAGDGLARNDWQLKFYRHSKGEPRPDKPFLEVPMPGWANVSFDRTLCYTADQAPIISRDPLYSDLLMLTAPSRPTWLEE